MAAIIVPTGRYGGPIGVRHSASVGGSVDNLGLRVISRYSHDAIATSVSAVQKVADKGLIGYRLESSSNTGWKAAFPDSDAVTQFDAYTVIVFFYRHSTASSTPVLYAERPNATQIFKLSFKGSPATELTFVTRNAGNTELINLPNTGIHVNGAGENFVAFVKTSNSLRTVYANGAYANVTTSSGGTYNPSLQTLLYDPHSSENNTTDSIYYVATVPRALSIADLRRINNQPWDVLPKQSNVIYFPSAGGGGATITPTGLSSSAFGSFSVNAGDRIISFTGKASDEAFGTFNLRATRLVSFTGKSSDEAFGAFSVHPGKVSILLNSKTTDEIYGTHSLLSGQKLISPSGKATDEAYGSFIIVSEDRILLINGKTSDEAFGTHSINALTDTQSVYPSGYFDSAIGAFSLRPDQYIIFEGQEYLEFGQFLLSGSAVVRAMHFFDWVAQQPGLRGSLNDKLYQYLREHGFTGSTPTMLFLWLRSLGYAGNTATMLTSFERDYTTRWH